MNRIDRPTAWDRFLEAEGEGQDAAAEAALAELFRELPERRPRSGFPARVMARVAAVEARRRSWLARPAARIALAAAALAVAVSSALLLPMVGPLARWVGPGGAVELFVTGLIGLATRFAGGLAAWSPLVTAARALGLALLEPRLAGLMFFQLLVAALALRALVGIVSAQRSHVHVAH
jgi:hypothetical protein